MSKEPGSKLTRAERSEEVSKQVALIREQIENISNQLNHVKLLTNQYGFKKTTRSIISIQNYFMQAYLIANKEAESKIDGSDD